MRALATALLGVVVATAPALAQTAPEYDPTAEVTVTGRVVGSHESVAEDDHPGLHFVLEIGPAPGAEPAAPEAVVPEAPVAGETATEEPEAAAAPEPAAGAEPGAPAAPEPAVAAEPEPAVAEANTVEVHACPMDLLGYLDFPIEEGDELTVTGSRPAAGPIIIAREIVKGTVKLQVRDAEGVPIWEDLP
jgi:hypothetical protein